jgi:hypothetical protein
VFGRDDIECSMHNLASRQERIQSLYQQLNHRAAASAHVAMPHRLGEDVGWQQRDELSR